MTVTNQPQSRQTADERSLRATRLLCEYRDGQLFDDSREDDLETARRLLRKAMPLDSMIIDLWDWDVHFEDELGEDWLCAAAVGQEDSMDWCADALLELFLQKCAEFDMDYDQHSDPEAFTAHVHGATASFVSEWRSELLATYPALREKRL